jgi:nucleolar protein 58
MNQFFVTPSKNFSLNLVSFKPYKSIAEAVTNATAIAEGKLSKTLKRLLKKNTPDEGEKLAVEDTQLGKIIKARICGRPRSCNH